ncbi:DUF1835 domain-containing protein [Oceanobacillus iheyensis]|uniref:DUF1835 domain-containing protein n=1 Tax=Oceanobacillus iheyensis TaxID=182710 RepID=UPI00362DB444
MEKDLHTVHIIFGESPAGSLKVGLHRHENKVICFPDFLAIGPIYRLHEESGFNERYEWLISRLNFENNYLEEYFVRFKTSIKEIHSISNEVPIVVWTAENANEQIGLRFFTYLLGDKPNDVYILNTTLGFHELYDPDDVEYVIRHSGEINSTQFRTIFEEQLGKPLTMEERKQYVNEWMTLSDSKKVLRIWKSSKVKEVEENYFDSFIINSLRNLHNEQNKIDFMKAAKLIGEVYGQLDEPLSDTFIEYRIRELIDQGNFEIKGTPKNMRSYSVKLR